MYWEATIFYPIYPHLHLVMDNHTMLFIPAKWIVPNAKHFFISFQLFELDLASCAIKIWNQHFNISHLSSMPFPICALVVKEITKAFWWRQYSTCRIQQQHPLVKLLLVFLPDFMPYFETDTPGV